MTDIRLHPEKGLNPFLTYCPRCGGEGQELILVGANDGVYECESCKTKVIGRPTTGRCPKCDAYGRWKQERTLQEGERLPGGLCQLCEDEEKKFKEVVAAGGVRLKCKDCGMRGVLQPHHPLCATVRKELNVPTPGECGLELTKEDCPECQKKTSPPT